MQKSAGKVLASVFWEQYGILLINYLPKGQTIKAKYYSSLPGANEGHFEDKMPREVHQGGLVLHDNVPAHQALATHKKLAYLGFHCLDHPPYSPDLAPSDYYLFLGLKKQLKVRHFSSDFEVIAAAETWLDGKSSEFFLSGLQI